MFQIHCGDCAEVMAKMEPASVDCVVTSPPYDKQRTYGGLAWDFEATAQALFAVMKPGGVVCWNVNDSVQDGKGESLTSMRQAIYFVDRAGFQMHDTMIWQKSNFSNPERVRYHQLFEYVFILSKGKPAVFNPILDKVNKYGTPFGKNTFRQQDGSMAERKKNEPRKFGMRGNVWLGNTRGQEDICQSLPHPAMMPKWLARDLILSWSNPSAVVLDPFAGSGTTGRAAIQIGRRFVGIEKNPDYIPLIEETCKNASIIPST